MTRIVAGTAKGRTLAVPSQGTRPTSERVREALFSRLDHMGMFDSTRVLDLYAGSGALGLEAASRGAASVDLVENSSGAARIIARNITATGLPARVHCLSASRYLSARTSQTLGGDVDLVLIDPPYDADESELEEVLALLGPWITPDALVVVERSTRSPEPVWPDFLVREDERSWGETRAWFAGPPAPEANDDEGDEQ